MTRMDEQGRVITQQTYKRTGAAQRIVRSLEDGGSVYHVELVYSYPKSAFNSAPGHAPDDLRLDNYFNRIV